jgi:hypothetical protein
MHEKAGLWLAPIVYSGGGWGGFEMKEAIACTLYYSFRQKCSKLDTVTGQGPQKNRNGNKNFDFGFYCPFRAPQTKRF